MRARIARIAAVVIGLSVAAGCGSSGGQGPGFTDVSQLNAIWHITGTFGFLCNGSTENLAIDSKVYVFDGSFKEPEIRYPTYPTQVCGTNSFALQGSIDASGKLTGNVNTNGGSPVLSDTVTGSCNMSSCSGQSANTGLIQFAMSNTGENPFDGGGWSVTVTCSDQKQSVFDQAVTVANGAFTAASTPTACTANGSTSRLKSLPVMGTIAADGTLTLAQGVDASGTLSATATDVATISGSAGLGATIAMTRPPP